MNTSHNRGVFRPNVRYVVILKNVLFLSFALQGADSDQFIPGYGRFLAENVILNDICKIKSY